MKNAEYKSKRERYQRLMSQLLLDRSSFESRWRDSGDQYCPTRPRFQVSDNNRGERKNQKIIDSTGVMALRTLRSGMMAGITSPARPWFRLTTQDPDLAEFGPVKEWLHTVKSLIETAFLRSNLYQTLPIVYGDQGAFATAALSIEEDLDTAIRCYPHPIGSYAIANNELLKVNVFTREFSLTVRQLLGKFWDKSLSDAQNWAKFSTHVKSCYEKGNYETWINVSHIIEPNHEWDRSRLEAKYNKKFSSCYFEAGTGIGKNNYMMGVSAEEGKLLRESGYDLFPVLCPRWETTGEDVWGTDCPGFTAIGDTKALQTMQKRKAQAIEKVNNPPMIAPADFAKIKTSSVPGDVTYADEIAGRGAMRPIYQINPDINSLRLDIQDHQGRIKEAFYADLFLMLANSDRRDFTAREIEERHEEKLLALGPVLEQQNQDLLDPLIDITFAILLKQGRIPEPPEEIAGQDLKVDYQSIMAQAQKLVGLASLERFGSIAQGVLAAFPEAKHKFDAEQYIDVVAETLSIPPKIVRTDEQVAEIKAQEQQAIQGQQRLQMMRDVTASAKDLSSADMEGDNALTRMLSQARAGQLTGS